MRRLTLAHFYLLVIVCGSVCVFACAGEHNELCINALQLKSKPRTAMYAIFIHPSIHFLPIIWVQIMAAAA